MSDIVEMQRERMRRRAAELLPPAAGSGMIQSGDAAAAAAAAAGCFIPAQLGAKDKSHSIPAKTFHNTLLGVISAK